MSRKVLPALMEIYDERAISMSNNAPALIGKLAIQNSMEQELARTSKGNTVSFKTTEIFGEGRFFTETGISTHRDAAGNVLSEGKYMTIWKKKGSQYLCVREIFNKDRPVYPAKFEGLRSLEIPGGMTESDLKEAVNSLNLVLDELGVRDIRYSLFISSGENPQYFLEEHWSNDAGRLDLQKNDLWHAAQQNILDKFSPKEICPKMAQLSR